jgi:hypothetical protein
MGTPPRERYIPIVHKLDEYSMIFDILVVGLMMNKKPGKAHNTKSPPNIKNARRPYPAKTEAAMASNRVTDKIKIQ